MLFFNGGVRSRYIAGNVGILKMNPDEMRLQYVGGYDKLSQMLLSQKSRGLLVRLHVVR